MMIIHPHKGVDSIAFGMTRSELERISDEVPQRARRNQFSVSDYDFFEELGLFVYYDADDRCCAVEFTREARVVYGEYELFAHPAHEVRAWARGRDQDLEDKDGFVSPALGLCMYAPFIDEPGAEDEQSEPAQSFLAFRPGYYEEAKRFEGNRN